MSKFQVNTDMGAFPSGQRGQTVNLLAMPSVVRIHPLPPSKKTDAKASVFFAWWEQMIESTSHAVVGVFESLQRRPREFRIAIRLHASGGRSLHCSSFSPRIHSVGMRGEFLFNHQTTAQRSGCGLKRRSSETNALQRLRWISDVQLVTTRRRSYAARNLQYDRGDR